MKMTKMPPIILASQSPRRTKLLSEAGVAFEVCPVEVEELSAGRYFCHIALINALSKAHQSSRLHPEAMVIGADTVIELDHKIIGKPGSLEDARRILARLSGRRHAVSTAICICSVQFDIEVRFIETTFVDFRELDDTIICDYMSKVDVLDKAGAYNIDEHGDMLVANIIGEKDNVIGLPCKKLLQAIYAIEALSPSAIS